jgi:hypothetical protein
MRRLCAEASSLTTKNTKRERTCSQLGTACAKVLGTIESMQESAEQDILSGGPGRCRGIIEL